MRWRSLLSYPSANDISGAIQCSTTIFARVYFICVPLTRAVEQVLVCGKVDRLHTDQQPDMRRPHERWLA
jgi:hypothetical protein